MKFLWVLTLLLVNTVSADNLATNTDLNSDQERPYEATEERDDCDNYNPTRAPFFGDTHVHTRYSLDASTQGTRTRPIEAYQFAMGQPLGIQPWTEDGKPLREVNIGRPLDFAVVTDHAELIGEVDTCNDATTEGHNSWQCLLYRGFPRLSFFVFNMASSVFQTHLAPTEAGQQQWREAGLAPWNEMKEAAETVYDRSSACEFTSFVGYEWTGSGENVANLHRNVIFRNNNVPRLPISFIDAPSAQQLLEQLDKGCIEGIEGCDVVVIPHNSNLSDGIMFRTLRDDGSPITAVDASRRARLERLVEIMQHKGSSECYFGPDNMDDDLCAFEQLPYNTFRGQYQPSMAELPKPSDGFVRGVLNEGLLQQQRIGVNPFKVGFIGSTDTHLGTPGLVDEKDYKGHGGSGAPAGEKIPPGLTDNLEYNPGGLAVLWAEENSRDSLFAAMQRREAYGTSGPRILMRMFGGWELPENMCKQQNFAEVGYNNGVAMGGDLVAVNNIAGAGPRFAIMAAKDAGTATQQGMPLQRLQIIKGWLDNDGNAQKKVIDVAGNANNGASVDINSCETSGQGYDQLCSVWQDPEFSQTENAWYYARAVENPSCRWSQHICIAKQVDCANPETIGEGLEGCCSDAHKPVIQERAWSSPIWYTPSEV
jgi:hypothetical protein